MEESMECNSSWSKLDGYKIEDDVLYSNGNPFARLESLNEETGWFEGIRISDNQHLNGQPICGMLIMRTIKHNSPPF